MDKNRIKEVYETLNDDQKEMLQTMVTDAMSGEVEHSDFNAEELIHDGMKLGSLKEAVLAHADTYGIKDIGSLFPEAKLAGEPKFLTNPVEWVNGVLSGVHKLPFSRVKTMFVDLTSETLRAKGYIKGTMKVEDVFSHMKRTTEPTTIYKKQKIDRDDVIDITDFAIISWIRKEMKMKLDEELARAILFGDGRLAEDPYKIGEEYIRPILTDSDFYTVKVVIDAEEAKVNKYDAMINAMIRKRKEYKGTGNPTLYISEDTAAEFLLMKDSDGRKMYKSLTDIAQEMRVSNIVTVNEMAGLVRDAKDGKVHNVLGLMVNLSDYSVGTDRGGEVTMFDDFDIDYNQQKYLIETRCSGALTVPYSAMVIEEVTEAPMMMSLSHEEEDHME